MHTRACAHTHSMRAHTHARAHMHTHAHTHKIKWGNLYKPYIIIFNKVEFLYTHRHTHICTYMHYIHSIIPSPSFPDFLLIQSMKNTLTSATLTKQAGQSSHKGPLLPHYTVPNPKRSNFHSHHH